MLHQSFSTSEQVAEDFRRVFGEWMRHDPVSGFNVWGTSTDPVMLVWSPRILEFLVVLESRMSYFPARGIVREVGYRSGFDGAQTWTAMSPKEGPVPVLLAMGRILSWAGWGMCDISFDDATKDVVVTFPKGTAVGVAAQRAGGRTRPACAFYEGFAAGWVKGSVDLDVEFDESTCRGVSGGECRLASRPLG